MVQPSDAPAAAPLLSAADVRRRFPTFALADDEVGMYEAKASGHYAYRIAGSV